jgi:hypothetical protein
MPCGSSRSTVLSRRAAMAVRRPRLPSAPIQATSGQDAHQLRHVRTPTVLVIVPKRSPHTSLNGIPLGHPRAPDVDSHCPGSWIQWRIEKTRPNEFPSPGPASQTCNGVSFCPKGLVPIGADRNAAAQQRLEAGTQAHRDIGRHTDHLRDLDRGRRRLLVAIGVLVALLLLQVVGQPWIPHP